MKVTVGFSRPPKKSTMLRESNALNILDASSSNESDSTGDVLLLGEVAAPSAVSSYDHFECTFYNNAASDDNSERMQSNGKYEIRLNLRDPSLITIEGRFVDASGSDLGCSFTHRRNEEMRGLLITGDFYIARPIGDIFLSATAQYRSNGKPQIVTHTVQAAANDDKFHLNLFHPTKRATTGPLEEGRIFGRPENEQGGGQFNYDSEHILIALLRWPENTEDIDYMCGYTRTKYNKPYLGLPGSATLDIKDDVTFMRCIKAHCRITEIDSTGGAMIQGAYYETGEGENNEIISVKGDNQRVEYTMPKIREDLSGHWTNDGAPIVYKHPPNWTQTHFHYEMYLSLEFDINNDPDAPHPKQYDVIITSDRDRKFSKSPGADSLTVFNGGEILPLRIMFGCLEENTKVLRSDGQLTPIRYVKIGDSIMTTGGGHTKVRNVWRGNEAGMLDITFADTTVCMTKDHPVLAPPPYGYRQAQRLKVGDMISIYRNNETFSVPVTSIIEREGYYNVYNLDTENDAPFIAESLIVGTNLTQNAIIY